jgi:hypothetical protein
VWIERRKRREDNPCKNGWGQAVVSVTIEELETLRAELVIDGVIENFNL